jgi:hypothetical protein
VEPCPGSELVVSLFEVPYTPASVAAFIAREHEFRLVAVRPHDMEGQPLQRLAVRGAKGGLEGCKVCNTAVCTTVSLHKACIGSTLAASTHQVVAVSFTFE